MNNHASDTVLAIETSCDETAVAILRGTTLLASEVASQIAIHAPFGGVVPEVASRNHLRMLKPVLQRALAAAKIKLDSVNVFAATTGPGLATSLMVGTSAAKGLAVATGKPYLAINHLEGHLLSPFFGTPQGVCAAVGLVVSGGHTMLVDLVSAGNYKLLGQTADDGSITRTRILNSHVIETVATSISPLALKSWAKQSGVRAPPKRKPATVLPSWSTSTSDQRSTRSPTRVLPVASRST